MFGKPATNAKDKNKPLSSSYCKEVGIYLGFLATSD